MLFTDNIINKNLYMQPRDMINYLTSIKDYTIITIDEKSKNLEEYMINNDMKVYYVNLNDIFDKKEILNILKSKYKHLDSGEDLWIFHRGFFIGSREDVYKIINKKKL
jgi:hypothetical protein